MKAGWKTVKLRDVADITSGLWKGELGDLIEAKVYRATNFIGNGELSDDKLVSIPVEVKKLTKRTLEPGDILLEKSGGGPNQPVGRVGFFDKSEPLHSFSNFTSRLRVSKGSSLDPKFLHKYLFWTHLRGDTASMQNNSTNIRNLDLDKYRELEIPLPPLAEQKRIVALLDEALAGIDAAKAKAEANLRDAKTLFASRLQETLAQAGHGWTQMRMEEIVAPDCSLSYGIVQPGEDFSEGMPIVRPTDLTSNVIHLPGLKRIDPKLAEGYARTTLQGGELLLCVRGSTGAVSIASEELAGANVTRGIVPVRFNKAMVLPDFGFYLISGGPVQAQIQEKTYGTALMQINIRDLRLISVSIPPLSEQKDIARKMADFHAKVQALTDLYALKASSLASLRNSLLSQAFAGELTT